MLIVLILARVVTFGVLVIVMLRDAFEMRFELAVALLTRKRADLHVDVASSHLWLLIALAHGLEIVFDFRCQFMAQLLVGHLTTTKLQLDAHLMPLGQKVFGVDDLDEIVMRIDANPEFHLLHLAGFLMLVGLLLVFLLNVLELAVVDDFADWRVRLRRHLNKVKTALTSNTQRLMCRQNAKLMLPVFLNHSDFRRTNPFIDAIELV